MQLGRVVGTVVSTIKAPGLNAYKLLLVSPFDTNDDREGARDGDEDDLLVAVDLIGAGEGDIVLLSQGSAARVAAGAQSVPTDAAIIAIIDTVQIGARTAYSKK